MIGDLSSFAARYNWPTDVCGPLIIGHRGACGHEIENTLGSFARASALGAQMWELDARVTRDGVCVVSHDDHLERVFGLDRYISALSWRELRDLPGHAVPDFLTVAALARRLGAGLYVEVKAPGTGPAVWKHLQTEGLRFATIGSFDFEVVRELRDAGCEYPLAVLVRLGDDPIVAAEASGADIVHLCWENGGTRPQDLVNSELVSEAARRRLEIVLWHEERPEIISELIRMPVLGICSDLPERVRAAIEENGA